MRCPASATSPRRTTAPAGTASTILGLLTAGSQIQAYSQATTGSVGRFSMFRHGVTLIEGAGGMPTGAVMNHADWETFELSVGLDDHWMLPGGANGNSPSVNFSSTVNNYSRATVTSHEEDDGEGGRRVVHTVSDQVVGAMNTPGTSLNREMRGRGAAPARIRR